MAPGGPTATAAGSAVAVASSAAVPGRCVDPNPSTAACWGHPLTRCCCCCFDGRLVVQDATLPVHDHHISHSTGDVVQGGWRVRGPCRRCSCPCCCRKRVVGPAGCTNSMFIRMLLLLQVRRVPCLLLVVLLLSC